MRVLLIEGCLATAQILQVMLCACDHSVYVTDLGEEGIDLARHYEYDVVLLGDVLPDMKAAEVVRRLRISKCGTPIIVLRGESDTFGEAALLDAGADDCVQRPFHRDVLVARMRAVVRRTQGHAENTVRLGPIALDTKSRQVTVDGVIAPFTAKEYRVLECLMTRPGTTTSREMLLNHLYGGLHEPDLKIVDVFLCKVRKKLANAGIRNFIVTVWGRGYKVNSPIEGSHTSSGAPEPAEPIFTSA